MFGTATGEKLKASDTIPRVDLKAGYGPVDCLGTYTVPFSARADYSDTWTGRLNVIDKKIRDEQISLTCSYAFNIGPGAFRIIGGANYDMATYTQTKNVFGVMPHLDMSDNGFGWRAGLAYEYPEYAMRASLMYFSSVDVDAKGTITNLPVPGLGVFPTVPVFGAAEIPQAVELKVQSGIAPGWLASASVKWVDWSVWQRTSIVATGGPLVGREVTFTNSYFRDGWTVSGSVGHQFTEDLAVQFGVTWDRGVSTGYTEQTDTWTASLGASYALTENVDLFGGIAATLVTGGDITQPSPLTAGDYSASWGTNHALAGQIGLKAHF